MNKKVDDSWLKSPLFFVFLSGLGFSLQAVVLKTFTKGDDDGGGGGGSEGIGVFPVVIFRGIVQSIASLVILQNNGVPLTPATLFGETARMRLLLFARSSFGFVGIGFAFTAIQLIPIGSATTLVMISPLISSILSWIFLNESISKHTLFAMPVTFVGVVLIVQPEFIFGSPGGDEKMSLTGILFAIIASVGAGFAYVTIRILGTSMKRHWCVVTLSQALGQVFYGAIVITVILLSATTAEGKSGAYFDFSIHSILVCLLIGVLGTVSQGLMTIGMQREKSAMATLMRMSDVLFSFFFQEVFTGDRISFGQVAGAIGICSGVGIVVWGKRVEGAQGAASDGDDPIEGGDGIALVQVETTTKRFEGEEEEILDL